MPVMTETERPVFPTDAEFAAAAASIQSPVEKFCNLRWHIDGVARFKGERAPTFEDIGKVWAFLYDVDNRMMELLDSIENIRGNLTELDYVRVLENVSDNPAEDGDDA